MHQLSFPAFAASRAPSPVAPVLPVRFGDPFALGRSPSALLLRDDWDWSSAFGMRIDATDYLPMGGHDVTELSSCFYVAGHQPRGA